MRRSTLFWTLIWVCGVLALPVQASSEKATSEPAAGATGAVSGAAAGTKTTPPVVPSSYTDLDCGAGKKLRLESFGGTCSVSKSTGVAACFNQQGDTVLDASCAKGCGTDPSLQARCSTLNVR